MNTQKMIGKHFHLILNDNRVELFCRGGCDRGDVPIAYYPFRESFDVTYPLNDIVTFRTYEDIDSLGLEHLTNVHDHQGDL